MGGVDMPGPGPGKDAPGANLRTWCNPQSTTQTAPPPSTLQTACHCQSDTRKNHMRGPGIQFGISAAVTTR